MSEIDQFDPANASFFTLSKRKGTPASFMLKIPQGREAGVWVIAETTELPTQFRRIVMTDDQGRYLVPDLPQADYSVWVRGGR